MNFRKILLPFLIGCLVSGSSFQYSFAKKRKKSGIEQKIDLIKNTVVSLAKNVKAMIDETDYDTSPGLEFLIPIRISKTKQVEIGFSWSFDSDPETAVGAGDINEGFGFMRGELISPTLKDMGLPLPGKYGSIRLLSILLGLQPTPRPVAKLLNPVLKTMGPALDILKQMLFVRGDTVFLIKVVILFRSYMRQNRLTDIPTELYSLFSRLSRTIDWKETVEGAGQKYDSMKGYSRRDFKKIEYFKGPSSFVKRSPKLVQDVLYDIPVDLNEENFQKWQDLRSGPTKFMYARSDARKKKELVDRIELAKGKIIPLINDDMTFTDKTYFVYFCERLVDEVLASRDEELKESMLGFLDESIPAFKGLKVGGAAFQKDIHSKNIAKIDAALAKLKESPAEEKGEEGSEAPDVEESEAAAAVKVEPPTGKEFPGPVQKWQRPVPLPDYLDFMYWRATGILFMPFYGDPGYLYDDSILPYGQAAQQLIAIVFRAITDIKRGVVRSKSKRRHPEDVFVALDKDGDSFESKGKDVRLGRGIWDKILGTKVVYKRDPKSNRLLSPRQVETPGTGPQGAYDDAKLRYETDLRLYKSLRRQRGSKHRFTTEQEKKLKTSTEEYKKTVKALSKAKRAYEKLIFEYYRFDRAPYLLAKTIIDKSKDHLITLNPARTDIPVDKSIDYRTIVSMIAKEDRDFFARDIQPLREERIKMFMIREVVILIFTRTKHGKKILFDPGVGKFLGMAGLSPDELLEFAGTNPDEILAKQDEWLDDESFEEEEEEEEEYEDEYEF